MVNFRDVYLKYLEVFKTKIKGEFVEDIFPEDGTKGIELKRIHTKYNQDPEALTADIIREMLRECKIKPLEISREIVIKGKSKSGFKEVIKKPDFLIESHDPNDNGFLFELEHLNKVLDKIGDKEGIEQAREWYSIKPTLVFHYDSIITNFTEWYLLKCNLNKDFSFNGEDFTILKINAWEILEIIVNRKFGMGKEYIIENLEEKKTEITNKFYNGFQERLKKLLKKSSKIEIDIEVRNYKKEKGTKDKIYEQNLIDYYRTIFSRLLFIKILKSWKLLPIDPINKIIEEDKRHWNTELRDLFFHIFNEKKETRPDEIPEEFKELPYLNGGLFRPSGIEIDNKGILRNIDLNPEAIKDIWDFFKGYNFLRETPDSSVIDSNTINPEILGYIFERSIGDERKLTGSYYTPEEITNYMVENTLFSYVIEKVNEILQKSRIKEIKTILDIDFLENPIEIYEYILNNVIKNIKICDPACGSGAFLEKVAHKLLYLYKKCYKGCGRILPYMVSEKNEKDSQMPFADVYSVKKYIIQKNIYGVDLNPSAIEICELRLWLWVIKPPEIMKYSTEDFNIPPLPNIEYNIRCGNSLIGYSRMERLIDNNSDKFLRIDDHFLSKYGSSIKDILKEKKEKIQCYYQKDESIEESKKEKIRSDINEMILDFNDQLNALLLSDYKNQEITIPLLPLDLSKIEKGREFRKKLIDKIRELNINNDLTHFKITFKKPVNIDHEKIRKIEGVTCSTTKGEEKLVKSIYPTSKFKFDYMYEHGKKPFSKFLPSLIEKWEDVDNIEFQKHVGKLDLESINPFHWVMEFSDIFDSEDSTKNGFDIIIGNPPHGNLLGDLEKEVMKIEHKYSEPNNTAEVFIERSFSQLKLFGRVGYIIPKTIGFYSSWSKIRKLILDNHLFESISDLGIAFIGVNFEQLALIVQKLSKENSPKIADNMVDISIATPLRSPNHIKKFEFQGNVLQSLMQSHNIFIFRAITDIENEIIEAIDNNSLKFREIYQDAFRGLYISDKEKEDFIIGARKWINKVPDVKRYYIKKISNIEQKKKWEKKRIRF